MRQHSAISMASSVKSFAIRKYILPCGMTRKDVITIVGFLLFILGFTAITLSLVGIKWSFLAWMDRISTLFGFVAKILMIIAGIVMVAMTRMKQD